MDTILAVTTWKGNVNNIHTILHSTHSTSVPYMEYTEENPIRILNTVEMLIIHMKVN